MLTPMQAQEQLREAIIKVGGTPAGQRVLSWVIYSLSMLEDGAPLADPEHVLIHEGRRSVGRMVLNELRRLDHELGTNLDRAVHEIRYLTDPVPAEERQHG